MTKEEKKIQHNKSKGWELVRFLICGLAAALMDYLTCELSKLFFKNLSQIWIIILSTTCGFIVGVIVNYFISTYWVYRNVKDEKASKTPSFIIKFIILSACALVLSIGTMALCELFFKEVVNIDISKSKLKTLFTFTFWGDTTFWCYFASFCLKTIVGLIWNYFTRKKILYIAPKDEENNTK